jgi:hypothetical protein
MTTPQRPEKRAVTVPMMIIGFVAGILTVVLIIRLLRHLF